MSRKTFFAAFALLAGLSTTAAWAGDDAPAQITSKLALLIPGQTPDAIEKTPLNGLYQIRYGTQVFYMSQDGRYVLQGNLLDMDAKRNLTDEAMVSVRKDVLDAVPENQMVVFSPPKNKVKHTITVFTDIDCPYCRKLHQEVGELNEKGIKVRYMLYPRAGVGSASYKTAVSVWCSDDRQKALTMAKNGEAIEPKTCDNPVVKSLEVGHEVGVTGTPAIFLEDGTLIPGYRPAEDMAKMLEQKSG